MATPTSPLSMSATFQWTTGIGTYAQPVPPAPVNLTATPVGTTQVNTGLPSPNINAAYTEWSYKTTAGSSWTVWSLTPAATVGQNITGLSAATSYDFRARYQNTSGYGVYSNVATVSTVAPPSVPALNTPVVISSTQLNVSLNAFPANSTLVSLERSLVSASGYAVVASLDSNTLTYADASLVASTQYFYRARSTGPGGTSGYSTVVNNTTASASTGVPVINSVSGSITQNGVFTINGSGFTTTKSNLVYSDNFDSGTVGQPLSGPNVALNVDYNYSATSPFSGTQCVRADWNFIQPGGAIYSLPDMTEVLIDVWCRIQIPTLGSTGDQQIKLTRLCGGHTGDHASSPTILPIWQMGNSTSAGDQVATYVGGDGNNINDYYDQGAGPSLNTWERYTIYGKIGTINVANGGRCYRTSFNSNGYTYSGAPGEFADPTDTQNRQEINSTPQKMHATGDSFNSFGQFFLPFYQRSTMHSIIDIDCLTVHDGLGRVEFGDNPNWLLCNPRKRVIQPAPSRTATTITGRVELGSLGTSGNIYAFVFNNDGTRNTVGFQVR